MADDPAFVWERLEGPTPGPPRRRPVGRDRSGPAPPVAAPEPKWATLREAAEATGMPVSTLRNWARKGRITTRMEDRVEGPRRLVDLSSVLERARALGRLDDRSDVPQPAAEAHPPASPAPAAAPEARREVPEGQMLVPLEAWDKMLMQLGNLHEAGQQLADARERAAKAETEATFLRERVADLRSQRDELRDAQTAAPTQPPADPAPSAPDPPPSLWMRLYRQWQRRSTPR